MVQVVGYRMSREAAAFVAAGDNSDGGRVVTNPSGGLLSKGHPLGATGLAQCYALTQQLRGAARPRRARCPARGWRWRWRTTWDWVAPAS